MQTQLPLQWLTQSAEGFKGTLDEVIKKVPQFGYAKFGEGNNANEDLLQVVRQPTPEDLRAIPVGVVSKRYWLIQHTDIIVGLLQAAKEVGANADLNETRLYLSKYGERMYFEVEFDDSNFDPGDGYPLRPSIACQNSVDGSCALEIRFLWVRLICSNGMMVRENTELKLIHSHQRNRQREVTRWLSDVFSLINLEREILTRWYQTPINVSEVIAFADTRIADLWGKSVAARICSIARTGMDGEVKSIRNQPPSNWFIDGTTRVPGLPLPVTNIYHLAQILSWVASHTTRVEERWERIFEINRLIGQVAQKRML